MSGACEQSPLNGVEETKVEKDIARILPPDKEDLRVGDPRKYGLCIIGEHTVAGVAVADRTAYGPQRAQKKDDQGAEQAKQIAQRAQQVAEQARQLAEQARQHAQQHHGGAGFRDRASKDLIRSFVGGSISPNAAARELLELRVTMVSRSS